MARTHGARQPSFLPKPSYDPQAEQGVIGSIVLDSSLLQDVLKLIRPADFFDEANRLIFLAAISLIIEGKRVDPTLLVDRLKSTASLERSGGEAYIVKVAYEVPTAAHATYYAEIVAKHARRREVTEFATRLLSESNRETAEPDQLTGMIDEFRESRASVNSEVTYRIQRGTEIAQSFYEIEYLIEGVYVAGQPMIIGGGKKNLKTNSLLDFGVSLTTGSPFLNHFQVNRRASVLIMTGESGEATVNETLKRIARAKGVELNDDLMVSHDLPRIEDPSHVRAFKQAMREYRPEVVVLDPAYLMMTGDDAQSLFKTGAVLRDLAEICKGEGAGICVCHHTRKKSTHRGIDPFTPPELEDLSYAGFQEFARQWILYSRREAYDPEQSGHHELWLSLGGSAGHSSLWSVTVDEGLRTDPGGRRWDVAVNPPSVARQNSQREAEERRDAQKNAQHRLRVQAAREAIEDAIMSLPRNEGTRSAIVSKSGKRGVAFDDAWDALIDEGKLQPCEISKSNHQTYPGFRWVLE